MGYDNPRSLGDRETGGGLSLPVWVNFMETALKGVPVMEPSAPQGVVNVGGEWYFEEYARGAGVGSLGVAPTAATGSPQGPPEDKSLANSEGLPPNRQPLPASDERKSILDLFRN
jgi:penicillin-binding protein 1A